MLSKILPVLILICVLFLTAYIFGIGHYRVDYCKGAYWPDYGYSVDKIYIWHNGHIVYLDDWNAEPDQRDSLYKAHLQTAQNFIDQKKK